ncbi:glucose 1-dehydrogenase [Sphingobium sp. CR2-8]|uniref:SDR family NAD(P)-dependent oxidoreductase n=1 Tax=Sphingobium sp. CR2-8 TaxID=1306534 RepID=UPI002DBD1F5A|nr:glucose 1-dehydrogenase [Sphingobium sp. CR2-8]MEC3909537.1 glucose 1-dehydrogenase [Sphingobium sp. CR2-8]
MQRWRLDGKVALVTGASGGLGAYFAKILAAAGASVIIGARRLDALQSVTSEITALGGICETVSLDVTRADSIAAIAPVLERVDILVNNAGLVRDRSALEQSEEDWDAVIDTNLKGMFLMAQAVARAMQRRNAGGTIINIASILGLRQAGGVLPYAVSKAGAIQMTKTLALELARYKIRVNALAPGYVATELNDEFWRSDHGKAMIKRIPQRRLGQVDDLEGPLLLLASDLSTYMTGSVIEVDGGHLVSTL